MGPQQKATASALSFVDKLNKVIIFPLITLLSAVAFLVFLWGCAEYIIHADNQTAREKGVKHITWGIIGLVVMVTAWAILSLAAGTFGLQGQLDCAKAGNCDNSSLIK
jgi:TRAP-type C4-dicarboxylate transport system permease small subunit